MSIITHLPGGRVSKLFDAPANLPPVTGPAPPVSAETQAAFDRIASGEPVETIEIDSIHPDLTPPIPEIDLSGMFDHVPAVERPALESKYRESLEQLLAGQNLTNEQITYAREVFLRRIVRFDKQHRTAVNENLPLTDHLVKRVLLTR